MNQSDQDPEKGGENASGPEVGASDSSNELRSADTLPLDAKSPGSPGAVERRAPASSLGLNTRIDRYEILESVGRGGMGAVYKARDLKLDRVVALKTPFSDSLADTEAIDRFTREAQAMASLRHPNLCPVYDVGCVNGIHFLTMAYIEGESLSDWIKDERTLSAREIAALIRKLALALETTHHGGVIHRDIKPSNVMIEKHGEPVLMDFGLALRSRDDDGELTQSGTVLGSPFYMAPEQVEGERSLIGPHTDVYGLGVILYQLLAGRRPFEGSIGSVLAKIVNAQPIRPAEIRPDTDPRLEQICLKALSKTIDDRHASAAELAEELDQYLQGKEAPGDQVEESESLGPAGKAGAALAFAAILILTLTASGLFSPSEPAEEPISESKSEPTPLERVDALAATAALTPEIPRAASNAPSRISESGQRLGAENSASVRLADFDLDGDLDAFVANRDNEPNRLWLNQGDGTFLPAEQRLGESDSRHVSIGDLDGDGDFDAFVSNATGQPNRAWLNEGNGMFSASESRIGFERTQCSVLADFDADGDLDAVTGENGGNRLWLNDGNGRFSAGPEPFGSSDTRSVAAADFDGDGLLDVFEANAGSGDKRDRIWLNNGDGRFLESGHALDSVDSISVAMTGMNAAASDEWYVASSTPGLLRLWSLAPEARLKSRAAPISGEFNQFRLGDLDGDGAIDLLGIGEDCFGVLKREQLNQRTTWGVTWSPAPKMADFDLGDLDNDGDLDVFIANDDSQPNYIWNFLTYEEIAEAALFQPSPMRFPASEHSGLGLADLDGDDDLDIVFGGMLGAENSVWLNDGKGFFHDTGQVLGIYDCYSIRIADFNGDGAPDALVANRGGPSQVWFNDGKAKFAAGMPIGNSHTDDFGVADFDGDGDVDLWQANLNPYPDRLFFNDGKGNFTEQDQELTGPDERAWAVLTVDIDADGDIDVLTSTAYRQPNSLWINDGQGRFERSDQLLSKLDPSNGFAAGDVDGDGDVDLFEAITGGPDRIWYNDGEGRFSDRGKRLTPFHGEHSLLEDFDMDGDLDAFVANSRNQPNFLWLNDGSGEFHVAPSL